MKSEMRVKLFVVVAALFTGLLSAYAVADGTSFAAPYASAVVALIDATNPKLDAASEISLPYPYDFILKLGQR